MKPIVKYRHDKDALIEVGKRATVWPVNHPSKQVSNRAYCLTSVVQSFDPDIGRFETAHTIYVRTEMISFDAMRSAGFEFKG